MAAFTKLSRIAAFVAVLALAFGADSGLAKPRKKKKAEGKLRPDAARVMIFDPDEPKASPRLVFDPKELAGRFDAVMLFTDVQVSSDSKSSEGETVEVKEQKVTTEAPPVVDDDGGKKKKNGNKKQKSKKAEEASE